MILSYIKPQEQTLEFSEVIILNRKYKCRHFKTEQEADLFISENPHFELICSENGFHCCENDNLGIEITFIPYEFKKYNIENTKIIL